MKRKTPPAVIAGVVAAGFLLFALLGYVVLISPQRSEAEKLDGQIREAEQQIAASQAARQQQAEPLRVAELFRLTKAMPDRSDMPGVLLELSRVAANTGITFHEISPQAVKSAPTYQMLPINLVFEGNFYELSDFLYRLRNLVAVRRGSLEAAGRLFAVESLDFAEGLAKFPQIQAKLTVNAFVYGAPPGTAASAGTATTTTTTTTTTTATSPPPPPPATSAAGTTR